jgi:hypothetical protein
MHLAVSLLSAATQAAHRGLIDRGGVTQVTSLDGPWW